MKPAAFAISTYFKKRCRTELLSLKASSQDRKEYCFCIRNVMKSDLLSAELIEIQ